MFLGRKVDFLVDSGAERSVVPRSYVPDALLFPSRVSLTGASGAHIKSFGQCSVLVGIRGLRREFPVTFIAASTQPILGADFLTQHGLLLNMKSRTLHDPLTSISATLKSATGEMHSIQTTAESKGSSSFLSQNFPRLLQAPDYSFLPNSQVSHSIHTTGAPLFCRPRPLSPAKLEIAKREFDVLLKLHIVQPSSSPWASPLHMVKKSDGSWRPCGDYRRLNAVTVPDRYPIPNIEHFHHGIHEATVFSKIDLVKAYHFIPVAEQDIPKTAICTPFGSFEYLRMPFGLRNSSGTFQRFIDAQLREFSFTCAYLDDILIYSRTTEEHEKHLRAVFDKLSSIGLRVNEPKCEILKDEVEFLGYSINKDGIKPPESRIQGLVDLPEPKDEKEVMRVLGMFGFYQKCIPQYARLTLKVREAMKDGFKWGTEQATAFQNLKKALSDAVRISFPCKDALLTITADASNTAIGACLNQCLDGVTKPISFFSRKLSDREKLQSAFDRELLAVFAAVKKWRDIIDCQKTTVFTDHKPLVGAFRSNKPRLSDKQQRQLSFIGEYIKDVVHISGKDNVVADSMSRSISSIVEENVRPLDLVEIAKEQAKRKEDYAEYKGFEIGKHTLYCETSHPNPRPVVPADLRRRIFLALHGLSHPGIKATVRMLNTRYYWKEMKKDVQAWCAECQDCQKVKIGRHTQKGIKDIPFPSQRFTHVHIDIIGPLEPPDTVQPEKPRYLLTMIDSHTRWMEAAPLSDISSSSVCSSFLFFWIARFGPPLTLTTDRGTQFCSEMAEKLNELLGIHHIRTTAFNPRANGCVERLHRSLKVALKARGRNWLTQLPIVLLGLRMRPDEDNTSAYSRTTGEQPMMPHILPANGDMTELSVQLHQLPFDYAPTRRREAKTHIPEQLKTCSHIWLRIDRVRRPLEAPYQGPFEVLRREDDTFTIEVRGKPVVVSIDRVKPARLPEVATEDATKSVPTAIQEEESKEPTEDPVEVRTRSGRSVKFKSDPAYCYI